MISYHGNGRICVIRPFGEYSPEARDRVLHDIKTDDSIPVGASLLIDVRFSESQNGPAEYQDLVAAMRRILGAKLGSFCGVVMPLRKSLQAHQFQEAARQFNLSVGLFYSELLATQWLVGRQEAEAAVEPDALLVMSREHGNGYVSEVHRTRDGRFVGRARRATAPEAADEMADLDSTNMAQSLADAMAHPGASCQRCGRWVSLG
jgi:hypothetical protein